MDRCVVNREGSLWVFYQNSFSREPTGESSQSLSIKIQLQLLATPVVFSFVHAKCIEQERMLLWSSLLDDNPVDSGLWLEILM